MIIGLYSIRDRKSGFLPPTTDVNDDTAMRNFSFAVTSREPMFLAFSDDYDLYKIGEYNTDSGIIAPCPPEHLVSARSFLVKEVPYVQDK